MRQYRRRPRYVAPLPALLDAFHKPVGPQTLIDFTMDTAGSVLEDEVPVLLDFAEQIDDPWSALTLLAAGTHLPAGRGYNAVLDEIITRLRTLRDQSLSRVTTATIGDDGFPAQAPWFVRGIGDWTPLFVRVLAPKARAAVRPALFDDGYLDGVLRRHRAYYNSASVDEHDRLDDWAHDVLTLTPMLEVAELNQLRVTGRAILSESTRKAFEAGLAVGYAAHGEMTAAYELIRGADWQTEVIRTSALADLVTQIPSHALPEWLAQVHLILSNAYDRGPLWSIMNDRWPELTREQLWEVLDRWTSELPLGDRFGVYADILNYSHAIRALSGPQECERILDLLGIRGPRR